MQYRGYGTQGGFGSGGGILNEFKNAFNKQDNSLIQIILINLVVFLGLMVTRVILTFSGGEGLYNSIMNFIMLPAHIPTVLTRPWTLVTYFFAHEGVFHLAFNMLFLYWFGKLIKDFLGSGKIVSLYVLGGVIGGLVYLLIYNLFPFFADRIETSMMLGASAGVYAVVVGAATFMPNHTFFLMFLGPVKIKYIALFYVILSLAQSTGSNAGGELAHLGGAALGFVYIRQLQQGSDWGKWVHRLLAFFKSFFIRQPKVKVSYRKTTKRPKSKVSVDTNPKQETSQAEIDAILDKISQSGYESLTKSEKQKLFNVSKK